MQLSAWVAESGGRHRVSSLLGVTEQAVHYWLTGKATPKFETIFRIVELSRGRVSVKEIFDETRVRERCVRRRRSALYDREAGL